MGVGLFKYALLLFVILTSGLTANSQIGISVEYFPERLTLESDGPASFMSRNAGLVSVTSYFRLKNIRLEFIPYAGVFGAVGNYTINGTESNIKSAGLAIGSKILAYPLDFLNDCDCPTFNKTGMWFKKGFFFFIDPQFLTYNYTVDSDLVSIEDNRFNNLGMSIGLGIDFGLSAGFTLTPYAAYHTQLASFSDNQFVLNGGSIPSESFGSRRSNPLLVGILLQYRLVKRRY